MPSGDVSKVNALANPRLRYDLTRAVSRRVDPTDVEDVVQTTLLEAVAARSLPASLEEVRRFVFAIARQKVADVHRRRGREARAILPELPAVEPPSRDLLRWAERQLPPAQEQTLEWMLREGEGETLAEIAEAEKIAPPVVRKRVSRLRRLLRERWLQQAGLLGLLVLAAAALAAHVARGDRVASVTPEPPLRAPPSEPSEPQEPKSALEVAPPPASGSAAPSPPPARPRPSASPPKPTPTSTSAKEFPRAAAATALAVVNVDPCGQATTPEGSTHLIVTFDGDGSVSNVTVDSGVLAGRPETACLIQRFSVVRIPAFESGPVKVGKVVRVPAANTGPRVFPPPTFATATVDMVLRSVNLAQCFTDDASQATATVTARVEPDGHIAYVRVAFGDASHGAQARCASGLLAVARVPSYGGPAVDVRNQLVVNGKTTTWSGTFVPVPPPRPPPSRDRGF